MSLSCVALGLDHRHIYGMTDNMEKAGVKCLGFWTQGTPETLSGYTERFPGWKEEEDGSQRISKEEFIIPLINAIQELKAEVEMLKEKLNNGNVQL